MPHPLLYKLLIINDLSPRDHRWLDQVHGLPRYCRWRDQVHGLPRHRRWLDQVHGPTRHTTGPTRHNAVHYGPTTARNAALVQKIYGPEDAEGGGKHYGAG